MSGNVALILTVVGVPAAAILGAIVLSRWVGDRHAKLRSIIWVTTLLVVGLTASVGIGLYSAQKRDYDDCIRRAENGAIIDGAWQALADGKTEVAERFTNIEALITDDTSPFSVEYRALAASERELAAKLNVVAEKYHPQAQADCVQPLSG